MQEKILPEEIKQAIEYFKKRGVYREFFLRELQIIGGYAESHRIRWPHFPCSLTPIFLIKNQPDCYVFAACEKQDGTIVGSVQEVKKLLPEILDESAVLFKRSITPRPNHELWILHILGDTGAVTYGTREEIEEQVGEKIEIDVQFIKFVRQCLAEAEVEYENSLLTSLKIWGFLLLSPLYSLRQKLPRFLQKKDFSLSPVGCKVCKAAEKRIKQLTRDTSARRDIATRR